MRRPLRIGNFASQIAYWLVFVTVNQHWDRVLDRWVAAGEGEARHVVEHDDVVAPGLFRSPQILIHRAGACTGNSAVVCDPAGPLPV